MHCRIAQINGHIVAVWIYHNAVSMQTSLNFSDWIVVHA